MGGFQWHAISCSSNQIARLSGFSRAVIVQIKELLLCLPSFLKAMVRVKLPPAASQFILVLIPVELGICSTHVSEERQIHGAAGPEPTRAEQMNDRARAHLAAPISFKSLCVRSRVKEKEDVRPGVQELSLLPSSKTFNPPASSQPGLWHRAHPAHRLCVRGAEHLEFLRALPGVADAQHLPDLPKFSLDVNLCISGFQPQGEG